LHRQVCGFPSRSRIKEKEERFACNVVDQWFQSSIGEKMKRLLLDNDSLMYDFLKPNTVKQFLIEHNAAKTTITSYYLV